MSAPAGWYPQEDGRLRYWDGAQWTEHFQDVPAPSAPPPGVTYGQPGGHPAGGYAPQPVGYGPPPSGSTGSGIAKGCLIAAAIVGAILLALVIGGIVLFNRVKDEVDKVTTFPSATAEPGSPGQDGSGEPLELSDALGKGFTVGSLTVADGWGVEKVNFLDLYNITGMTATTAPDKTVLFDLEFRSGGTKIDDTLCTATPENTVVTCLPLTKDISKADEVVAESAF